MSGVTGPKPRPYRTSVSPGLAGRDATPAIAPAGNANAPSGKIAPRYCLPFIVKTPGAKNPGETAAAFMVNAGLEPAGFVSVICTGPVPMLLGTTTFT